MAESTRLQRVLEQGKFAVTAEITTPKGADFAALRKRADLLREYVDAVNVTDNQSAVVHLSAQACSAELVRLGMEPVFQMTCRDRNRIALQSDFLGALALGARNVLCLTGDHQSQGDEPQAKNVFDLDAVQLLGVLNGAITEGHLLGGSKLDAPVWAYLGGSANPFADPLPAQVMRLGKKVKAGARFIQTQGIFDLERFDQWMAQVRERGWDEQVKIIAGVIPLRSMRAAAYMRDEVPGVVIPDAVMKRLEKASNTAQEGVKICVETIERLKATKGVAGVHIMAIEWDAIVPEIVTKAGLHPRPAADK